MSTIDLLESLDSTDEEIAMMEQQVLLPQQLEVPTTHKPAPPVPFSTPPKLLPVEQVLHENHGTAVSDLRRLSVALARDAIFGREALSNSDLGGKKFTRLEEKKMEYIKTVVKSRVPNMPQVEFELVWGLCRTSISKSCQSLRTKKLKKRLL